MEVERARYEAEKAERRYRAWSRRTDSLLAVWKRNGKTAFAICRLPKQS
jgi:hypothetical protein